MMKRRSLMLVSFLVVLSIVAMSFSNVSAIAYEYSPESIEEFYETLPNDVLFYPDAILGDVVLASSGDDDYTDSFTVNAVTWAADDDPHEYAEFLLGVGYGPIETISYSLYAYGYNGEGYLEIWNGTSWILLETILETATVFSWYNGTVDIPSVGSIITVGIYGDGIFGDCAADYLEIRASYMTGANNATPVQSDPYFATGGDTGFGNTYAVDASNFSVDGVLEFSYDASNISSLVSFTYAIYGISAGTTFVHYSNNDVDYGSGPFDVITSEGWYNGTYNTALGALENTGIGYVWFATNSESSINYMEISFTYIPISAYGESFFDVSDWVGLDGTDGDVAYWDTVGDDSYKDVYTDIPSFVNCEGLYIEWRMKANVSTINGRVIGYLDATLDSGDRVFQPSNNQEGAVSTSWQTFKYYIPNSEDFYDENEAFVRLRLYFRASSNARISMEYIRVGMADEMGWQHDGRTTGISSTDGGTIASDGDLVTLTADGDGSTFLIVADVTATASAISTAYYPMFGIDIDSGSGSWTLEQYDGSAYATLQSSTAISAGLNHFNMECLDTYVEWWRISLTASGVLVSDWAKAYSIANFSSYSAHADIDTNDYFYTDSGVLYCEMDESLNDYIRMNYDPAMDVNYTIYNIVNSTVFKDGLQSDLVGYNWIDSGGFLQDNWTAELTQDLTGTPYLKIDDAGSWEIHDLTFYGVVPAWQIVTTVEIVFWVSGWHIINSIVIVFATEISTYAFNLFLLFLGLAMIPTSTIYLVWGGKNEMSMDKVFFGIVIFILGWALFLGGIM